MVNKKIAHWATNLVPRVCATLVLSGNETDLVTKLLSLFAQDQNLLAPCNRTWVFSCPVKENPAFIQHLLYLQERRTGLHGYQFCHKHK